MKLKFTHKTWYFFLLCAAAASMLNGFAVLMLSYMGRGWAAYICSALVWPGLLGYEYQKGRPIQRQLQLVGAAEVLHLLFVLLTVYGGMAGLSFWANLLWVLLACARGWAALSLYKMQEDA